MLAYTIASIAIGLAQVLDAFVLAGRKGVVKRDTLAFSFFEYVWVAVSIGVIWTPVAYEPRWYPLSFLAFMIIMVLLSFVFMDWKEMLKTDEIRIPYPLIYAGGAFGIWFSLAGVWLLARA